jgi:hypothetical protein
MLVEDACSACEVDTVDDLTASEETPGAVMDNDSSPAENS